MDNEEIVIANSGVILLGFPVGLAPTGRDFAIALGEEEIRQFEPFNGRVLRICDRKGLSWLVDLEKDLVIWLDILLDKLKYRPHTDHDPSGLFNGRILLGPYATHGPFSFETAEIVRKVEIPNISLNFVPDAKLVRALTVSFNLSERKIERSSDFGNNI